MRNKRNDIYSTDDHKRSGFWFGFALGTTAATSAIFLLGTKRGRASLKRAIELSEGLEETVFESLKELGVEALLHVAEDIKPKVVRTFTSLDEPKSTVGTFLEKVKRLASKSS
ncbi:hypothetical protein A3G67_01850 [Candidatus Roizmanbacteria bacterium RIFCSPLOWO2_12_FULL_40_12]|uniref:YtxH domain-containing protein n=1 Tax=Candidatus Roizmanbacteria bacterium RIFCSPLOWO2_01_FULL_40_42 TaxID=1802066 RepID=A0A1F7J3J1_9BACT|nr:MAG: hypothetical protein A2779_00970 [Candidatus Roizmanbacteria bacterium RIFCSPHIGHO2_01_FULL_40_98]OGK28938.1 MAG: hypothetical protein A3C31_01610 [Candidatus Roizmanbacteria bacterium RIFCSPHIGHO2_02_FULL_40_53]OGK29596.1 MAG: hypothetical protein A2W49_03930 [Candidatus Roizmanbacteria bacterium RIFCSPHIGHO2_12_41_18]OGK36699.1 MAG: hypothetical protein A3E69_03810 [Candidatus Roizmanbacteria bacterium RIFCSPHIGHO2_12_FULL_40_130]OGK50167.1 MAG: hypothetical protein A3B50_00065 [Candi